MATQAQGSDSDTYIKWWGKARMEHSHLISSPENDGANHLLEMTTHPWISDHCTADESINFTKQLLTSGLSDCERCRTGDVPGGCRLYEIEAGFSYNQDLRCGPGHVHRYEGVLPVKPPTQANITGFITSFNEELRRRGHFCLQCEDWVTGMECHDSAHN